MGKTSFLLQRCTDQIATGTQMFSLHVHTRVLINDLGTYIGALYLAQEWAKVQWAEEEGEGEGEYEKTKWGISSLCCFSLTCTPG